MRTSLTTLFVLACIIFSFDLSATISQAEVHEVHRRTRQSTTIAFVPNQRWPHGHVDSTPRAEAGSADAILPIGAKYHHTMKFPVLGVQAFRLRILSNTKAHLQISGMLTVDEVVPYTADGIGRLKFSLSDHTKRTLRRFKTRLLGAGYDPSNDTPFFKISPYILPAVTIRMDRIEESVPAIPAVAVSH